MRKLKILSLQIIFFFAFQQTQISLSKELNENTAWTPKEGLELFGTKAPSLKGLKWLNSDPIDMKDLIGKVVLIRFWLVDCPFCTRSAPSLVELYDKYKQDGFIVIGIHHPKSDKTKNADVVIKQAKIFGFEFPIAQDNDWNVLNSYWLNGKKRSYTSVSFLMDEEGIIRSIHDGGEFFKSDENLKANSAYLAIDNKIQELLKENP
ncbi:redoxin domain-containing protein [Desulfobacterota bacterium AH_259_B03_O07]|nr:redoxin domain-containing protein [Desulfobacterota bacterium AH_259_B03_O07]